MRILNHLLAGPHSVKAKFSKESFERLTSATAASEKSHTGEIRFAVEPGLNPIEIWQGIGPRDRALQVFSDLKIWDTDANNGVLIYLLLADRAVEIIADRGINAKVGEQGWTSICKSMQQKFSTNEFEAGVLQGIQAITQILVSQFPKNEKSDSNEIPDSPIVI